MNTHNTWVENGFGKSRGMKEFSFANRRSTGQCNIDAGSDVRFKNDNTFSLLHLKLDHKAVFIYMRGGIFHGPQIYSEIL